MPRRDGSEASTIVSLGLRGERERETIELAYAHLPSSNPVPCDRSLVVELEFIGRGELLLFGFLERRSSGEDFEESDLEDEKIDQRRARRRREESDELTPRDHTSDDRSSCFIPRALEEERYSGVPQLMVEKKGSEVFSGSHF